MWRDKSTFVIVDYTQSKVWVLSTTHTHALARFEMKERAKHTEYECDALIKHKCPSGDVLSIEIIASSFSAILEFVNKWCGEGMKVACMQSYLQSILLSLCLSPIWDNHRCNSYYVWVMR